jgi:hypothetical protein
MSANRRTSNSRLKFPTAKPVRAIAKMGNYASFYMSNTKENMEFESKIPRLLQNIGSFVEKSNDSKIPMIQRGTALNDISTSSNSKSSTRHSEYKDRPDIKARPFKRMVGFFVKKSDRKLTVPMEPKLSKPNRKHKLEEVDGKKAHVDIDKLNIPINLTMLKRKNSKADGSAFKGSECKSSQKCSNSENASTNCSKSRANSRTKVPIAYQTHPKSSINVK